MTAWPQAEQNFIKNRARSLSFCTIECSIHNAFNRFQETMSYRIDSSFVSENQDARVQILVLHYTENSFERALELLTKKAHGVSAHYLIPEQAAEMSQPFPVYQLVPEHGCAYHAGVSFWQGARLLNASSVGIEMANLGFAHEDQGLPLMARRWIPYPEAQFQAVGALAREIAARYQIAPHRVVGHSDIAPQRKIDPGPLFSWERLYREFGVGAWPDEDTVAFYTRHFPYSDDIRALQGKLAAYGYEAAQDGRFNEAMQKVVAAFQIHFRPARYDGALDIETAAILDALLEKYRNAQRPELNITS